MTINTEAITTLLHRLPTGILEDAPTTHLPTILPLALPTPLHLVNFLTTLHLIYDVISQPDHAGYFYETRTSPRDTAIRGTVSLFLASDEGWTASNLLSAAAWRAGKLDERAIAEHLEIQVVREREHETMKAIRVGERWDKGVGVAGSLVELFKDLGAKLKGQCLGEAVQELVDASRATAGIDVALFAKLFTEQGAQLVPGSNGIKLEGDVLSPAPLHLLYDLAVRQSESSDLDLDLPAPADLADVSPLPLSLPILLQTGIIPSSTLPDQSEPLDALFDLSGTGSHELPSTSIALSPSTVAELQALSCSASTEVRWATQTQEWAGGEAWKGQLTYRDLWRIFALLDDRLMKQGKGFVLVPT